MSRTTKVVLASAVGALVVVVVAVGALWYFVLRSDPPPPPSLPEREVAPSEAPEGSDADGTWSVVPAADGEEVFVGYRVEELLAGNTIRNTAVGRTPVVTGTMTIVDGQVTAVEIVADLRELQSDQSRRDNHLAGNALETNEYPEARFVLTDPIDLGEIPEPGEAITVRATGDLTLRDVTRSVAIDLEARWNGEVIDVNGLLPIEFADYEIATPSVSAVVEIDDHGQMELQLVFARD